MGHNRADEENCGILPDALTPLCSPHRATPSKAFYYDSTLKEVEDLQEKLRASLRENAFLKSEHSRQQSEIAALKREAHLQQERHDWEVESLRKSLSEVRMELASVEE
ncbi:PREDICTED: uncharacterized protein LOC108371670, partial [Rhagoletis zephyria]|uniref:uncharacterized protein LOC108371670 n=1 Tax=Rhagoletis zephyria TaxID=28612 RepID=UPI0008113447